MIIVQLLYNQNYYIHATMLLFCHLQNTNHQGGDLGPNSLASPEQNVVEIGATILVT